VRIEADFAAGKVYEIREDTGETIGERSVNEQDRQASIFDGTPPPTAEQQKAAEHAELEKRADAILDNAGDGKLTKRGRRKVAKHGAPAR
jgi:hypothetical protein